MTSSQGAAEGRSGRRQPVVDVHAHWFPADLPDWTRTTGDPRWPSLAIDGAKDGGAGRIVLGDGTTFRSVRAPLWDLEPRLAELDAAGVSHQLISPVPIMLTYWAEPQPAAGFASAVNDELAAAVEAGRGRLLGLGTVPMQDTGLAVRELERLVGELGLSGVEIGTTVGERDLDDASLGPFFDAAAELEAAVFVHPLDGGGGAIRRTGQPYDLGLGMLTDTAIAATALVCGGVLEHRPDLRIALAHGCGSFAWAAPRLRWATALTSQPELQGRFDELVRRLWVDNLVFDPEHLRLLVHRFGPGHVMVGTDFPFFAGLLEGSHEFVAAAADRGVLTADQADRMLSTNALEFLRRPA